MQSSDSEAVAAPEKGPSLGPPLGLSEASLEPPEVVLFGALWEPGKGGLGGGGRNGALLHIMGAGAPKT